MVAKSAQRRGIVALGIALARAEAHTILFRVPRDEVDLDRSGLRPGPVPVAGNTIGDREVRDSRARCRLGGVPDHAFERMSLQRAEPGQQPERYLRRRQYARGLTSLAASRAARRRGTGRKSCSARGAVAHPRRSEVSSRPAAGRWSRRSGTVPGRVPATHPAAPRGYSLGARPASSEWRGSCAAVHERATPLPPPARASRYAETAVRTPAAPTAPTPRWRPGRRFRRSAANTWARRRTGCTASGNERDRRRHVRGTPRRWWTDPTVRESARTWCVRTAVRAGRAAAPPSPPVRNRGRSGHRLRCGPEADPPAPEAGKGDRSAGRGGRPGTRRGSRSRRGSTTPPPWWLSSASHGSDLPSRHPAPALLPPARSGIPRRSRRDCCPGCGPGGPAGRPGHLRRWSSVPVG